MKLEQVTNRLRKIITSHWKRENKLISYIEAKDMIKENPTAILLDVRSKQEYDEYHLEGAICIPTFEIETKLSKIIENKNQVIITYCQSGARSKKAVRMLTKLGYTNVYEIEGGIDNL